jgi:hypothetical protein
MDFIDVLFCKRVLTKLENNGFNDVYYHLYDTVSAVDFTLRLDGRYEVEKHFTLDSLNTCRDIYPEEFVAQSLIRCAQNYYNSVACQTRCVSVPKPDFGHWIEKVIFNDPATIVIWKDGSKTVTKCGELDIYDPEKGLAMCFAKKLLGNEGNYYNVFTKWLPKEEEPLRRRLDIYESYLRSGCLRKRSR